MPQTSWGPLRTSTLARPCHAALGLRADDSGSSLTLISHGIELRSHLAYLASGVDAVIDVTAFPLDLSMGQLQQQEALPELLARYVQRLRVTLDLECPGLAFRQQIERILSRRHRWLGRWAPYAAQNIAADG